jgi:microcystin-dependent protein
MQIATHMALFSIIGTTYGGDGSTTFALPNLSGRAPIGAGRPRHSDHDYKVGQTVNTPTTGAKVEKQRCAAAVYAIVVEGGTRAEASPRLAHAGSMRAAAAQAEACAAMSYGKHCIVPFGLILHVNGGLQGGPPPQGTWSGMHMPLVQT